MHGRGHSDRQPYLRLLREVLDDNIATNGYSRLYASVFDCLKVYSNHGVISEMDFTRCFLHFITLFCQKWMIFCKRGIFDMGGGYG